MKIKLFSLCGGSLLSILPTAQAAPSLCKELPSFDALKASLLKARKEDNGGFSNDMWGAIVDREGVVCAVAFTGATAGDQWPGSRAIAAEKANTANALSLPHFAMSSANLYSGTQPGGFMYGIEVSAPANALAIAEGKSKNYGTSSDPLVGKKVGGVILFGGGLPLYNEKGQLLGALGVSGDTSCADHNIAWKTRNLLNLDYVPGGVSPTHDDSILYLSENEKPNGFKHPQCGFKENKIALPGIRKK